jgi:DNA-binding CsgD family transcriptional regulator
MRSSGLHYTRRQAEILALVAADMSDKEIARSLGVSCGTVRTHLRRLFIDRGIHSRAAAVAGWLKTTSG